MDRTKPRIPPGMRDFTPREVRQREWVIGRIRAIFERYGYEPIETPALELYDVLKGKLGEEGEQLLFKVLRRGTVLEDLRLGRVPSVTISNYDEVVDYALPYDLTVPFARFLAMHPDLPRPFKRYQIQRVWRGDRPQRGRYREFYQCDVDVAGTSAMAADAEMIAIVVETLLDLGFKDFRTHIGHRKLLDGLVESAGGSAHLQPISLAIDKLGKIGPDGVRDEMTKRGVPAEVAAAILERIAIEGSADEILTHLETPLAATRNGLQGIAETRELFAILAAMGVPADHYRLDLRLVRGLDYYTGPVHESIVAQPPIGSLTGGGRYDELIGRFTGQPIPATGTTIGLERIIDVMKEFEMLPAIVSGPQLLVTVFDEASRPASLALASELRRAGYRVEVPLQRPKGLKPQIAYASAKDIVLVAIMGPDEIASGSVTLRAGPGNQRTVPRARVADELRAFMDSLG
jgi:histidyl-tRNA synthetase